MNTRNLAAIAALWLAGCEPQQTVVVSDDTGVVDQDSGVDAGGMDAGRDTGVIPPDLGRPDAGSDTGVDAGRDTGVDTGVPDAGFDTGAPDTGIDAGIPDAGLQDTGVDAGTLVWVLEVWGYHVPDTWWTPDYLMGPYLWDSCCIDDSSTNPDVSVWASGGVPSPDTDLLDRAPTGPRWSFTRVGGSYLMGEVDPTGNTTIATCTVSPAEVAAAKADAQLHTTTCTSSTKWFTTGVTPDAPTMTWRVVATYQ